MDIDFGIVSLLLLDMTIELILEQLATLFTYRLTLHPLAKYPGPLLAKLTSFYGVYHAYLGDIHLDLQRLHEKHGDFVRYEPNAVSVASVDGFHGLCFPLS